MQRNKVYSAVTVWPRLVFLFAAERDVQRNARVWDTSGSVPPFLFAAERDVQRNEDN